MFYHDLTNFNGHNIIGCKMSHAYHSDCRSDHDYDYYRPKSDELVAVKFSQMVHQTDKAYLLMVDNKSIWLPKSLTKFLYFGILIVERWIADSNDLDYYIIEDDDGTIEFGLKPNEMVKYIRKNLLSKIIENLNKK